MYYDRDRHIEREWGRVVLIVLIKVLHDRDVARAKELQTVHYFWASGYLHMQFPNYNRSL